MFYIYAGYVLILFCLTLAACRRRKQRVWWAAAVLVAPVITPYVIAKFKKSGYGFLMFCFVASFLGVAAVEFHNWSRVRADYKYAHMPPMTRQIMMLADSLKETTVELDTGLKRLEFLSKVESRVAELKRTIDYIAYVRDVIARNQDAIDRLVRFTMDYESYFAQKDLAWVYHIREFYTYYHVIRHQESLMRYLDQFNALLTFTYENFSEISEKKNPVLLVNYDEYYLRYRRAVDTHNAFNVQRIEFQNNFILQYPEVEPYLPGKRQTDTFRLWE